MKHICWSIVLLFVFACTNDKLPPPEEIPEDADVWTGPTITFSKLPTSDPTAAENQDRITDNVWITRGNNGGQIYNAIEEMGANKRESPMGTLWAIGKIRDLNRLDFQPFRTAVGRPKEVVGKDLVLFLREDEVYLSVKFTAWGQQQIGSFSYERSTEN
ncbi:MAG: hypothetical protein AAF847_08490 [Bacteroidota bacterium]